MTLGEVQRVLQQLLREQVSIRDLGTSSKSWSKPLPGNKNSWSIWWRRFANPWGGRWCSPARRGRRTARLRAGTVFEEEIVALLDTEGALRMLGDGTSRCSNGNFLTSDCRLVETPNRRVPTSAMPVLLCSSPARITCGAGWSHLCRGWPYWLPRNCRRI